jgi:hypothetical protein
MNLRSLWSPAAPLALLLAASATAAAPTAAPTATPSARLSPVPAPGLWQVGWGTTVNGQDLGRALRAMIAGQMAQMPPDQRATTEMMMRDLTGGPVMGGTRQECLTPEAATRVTDPAAWLQDVLRDAPGCRFEPVRVAGGTLSFKGRCADPDGFTGDVTGTLTLDGPRGWTAGWSGRGRMIGLDDLPGMKAGPDGRVDYHVRGSGRWKATSCGGVRAP